MGGVVADDPRSLDTRPGPAPIDPKAAEPTEGTGPEGQVAKDCPAPAAPAGCAAPDPAAKAGSTAPAAAPDPAAKAPAGPPPAG